MSKPRRKRKVPCCKKHEHTNNLALPFKASKKAAERIIHILNEMVFKELFDHEIDVGELVVKLKGKGYPYYGHYFPFSEGGNKDDFSLRRNYETQMLFIETISHEMTHKYLWDVYEDYSHGKRFKECARMIKEHFGLKL